MAAPAERDSLRMKERLPVAGAVDEIDMRASPEIEHPAARPGADELGSDRQSLRAVLAVALKNQLVG
jgi:hypothetical protein